MGNWYCNNCNSYEESWAEKQFWKPHEIVRRDIRCWKCDKHSLIYTDGQISRYKELVKERTSILGTIEEVERFSTWWSNNIATVIGYYDGYYRVFLLVYDSVYSTYHPAVFPVDKDCNYWGKSWERRGKWVYSFEAKNEAKWLRYKLNSICGEYSKNPILLIHPYCDSYHSFETFVTEPYVVKKYSSSYLKPLDIVKTNMGDYYHAGVYLGKIDKEFKVCHFTKDKNNTTIDLWSYFLGGKVVGYHPIIPFKNYRDIAKQVVWAKDNSFRKENYSASNRNCEHFSNMVVYGINWSEQVEQNKGLLMARAVAQQSGITAYGTVNAITSVALVPFTFGLSLIPGVLGTVTSACAIVENVKNNYPLNNDKTSVCLKNEIRDTDNRLGKKYDYETEKYEKQYLQEVPSKEYCRII